jgi:hypothetical protein
MEGLRGNIDGSCSHPPHLTIPPGDNDIVVVDATTFQTLDLSFGTGHKDLMQFGRVVDLDG